MDERGHVTAARIVPPTPEPGGHRGRPARLPSSVLTLPDPEATAGLEALIRCYDPCISCATHFLSWTWSACHETRGGVRVRRTPSG
ncbi:MAG: hypothetical protein R3C32_07350 [Chloroflexota bacterium]